MSETRRSPTRRRQLFGSVPTAVTRGVTIGLVLGVFAGAAILADRAADRPAPPPPDPVSQRQADLVESGVCWRGGDVAPVAEPGSVLVTMPGADQARRVRDQRVVDQALDQIFGGPDHDLVVHAFCR